VADFSTAVPTGDLGACEFLAKPVDFDALKAQLRQLTGSL
jgi:ActR/RegA family two-component response regulator